MPVSTVTHCDQCGKLFQLKRNNKTGSKFCGNTCRQRAHRAKRKASPLHNPLGHSIDAILGGLRQEVFGTRSQAVWELAAMRARDKVEAILRAAVVDVFGKDYPVYYYQRASELLTKIGERLTSLEKQLKDEKCRVEHYRDLHDRYRDMVTDLLNRGKSGALNGLSTEDWDALTKMDDVQLGQWVKVGRTLHRQGRMEAGQDAVRWVEGNRVDQSKGRNANGDATGDSQGSNANGDASGDSRGALQSL